MTETETGVTTREAERFTRVTWEINAENSGITVVARGLSGTCGDPA